MGIYHGEGLTRFSHFWSSFGPPGSKVVCRRQIFACVQTSPISFVASLRSDQEYVAPAAAHKNHVHNIWLDKIKIILSFIVREYSSDISQ